MKLLQPLHRRACTVILAASAATLQAGCASAPRDESARILRPVASTAPALVDAPPAPSAADSADATPATGPAQALADDRPVSIIGSGSNEGGLLTSGLRTNGGGFVGALLGGPTRLWNFLRGRSPLTPAAAAAKMEDKQFPDERREGIATLVGYDFAKADPYTARYDQIARRDPDPLVRATAIRALNRARHADSDPTFIAALSDPEAEVRLEAVKALNRMPTAAAAGPLSKALADPQEPVDVRIAAAEALGHYQTLDVARALVAQLNGRDFGVAWQARRSLKQMLGADYRYDEPAWLAFLTGPTSPVS